MKSRVALIPLGAMLLIVPAAVFAADVFHTGQFTPANGYVPNFTLLTGPTLLAPAPKILSLSNAAKPPSYFVPGQRLERTAPPAVSDVELATAEHQFEAAEQKQMQWRADRDAALARKRELDHSRTKEESEPRLKLDGGRPVRLSDDPTRFDATLPEVPTSLLRKPQSARQGELYLKPAAPGRE
jgi:hypothetical protein